MSIKELAEKISNEKEAIVKKTDAILSEQSGQKIDEHFSTERILLAEYIAKGLGENSEETKALILEWADKASSYSIEGGVALDQSFNSFKVFKDQIWAFIYEKVNEGELDVNELFKTLQQVDDIIDQAGYGYAQSMLAKFEERIKDAEQTMLEDKQLIEDLSVPIIPSILPNTILIPVVGLLTDERFDILRQKLLQNITSHKAESVVCDFTGAILPDNGYFQMDDLAHQIEQLTKSLSLMGVEIIYVGFSSRLVQEIVKAGVKIDAETFSNFRTGLQYLAAQKGTEIEFAPDTQHHAEHPEDTTAVSIPSKV